LRNSSANAGVKYRGWSLDGEYYARWLNDFQATLVELQRRTVDLAIKMDPANVPWEIMGGLAQHVRVIGSMVPRIKADGADKTGVVHYSGLA
jgi:hypothetical protein